uniref:Ubiquitin-protein ligase E3A n=1 Tax=Anopheles atroparvus TaxID=41427 RepID=A0AAG5DUH1_ANOAO
MNPSNEQNTSNDDPRIDASEATTMDRAKDDDRAINSHRSNRPPASNEEHEMKRASAKKLIERYFYQLMEGCGNQQCSNKHCASSGQVGRMTPNAAAARAIQLFSQEAPLCCEKDSSKLTKLTENHAASGSSSAMTVHETKECIPTRSLSGQCLERSGAPYTEENKENNTARHMGVAYNSSAVDATPMEDDAMGETTSAVSTSRNSLAYDQLAEGNSSGGSTKVTRNVSTKQIADSLTSTVDSAVTTSTQEVQHLDEQILKDLTEWCTRNGSDALLIRTVGAVFSAHQLLANSFQFSSATSSIDRILARAPPGDLRNMKKEDIRSLEGDLDKDEDSKAPPDTAQAIPDPTYNDVDVAALRRSLKALCAARPAIIGPINNALQMLGESLSRDLRVSLKDDPDVLDPIVYVFVIAFETMLIASADFLEVTYPRILAAVTHLPIWGQSRLASIWARHCPDSIHPLLQQLQQLITITTLSFNPYRQMRIHDSEIVCNATKVMKIVYYANMLAGGLDAIPINPELRDTSLPPFLSLIPEDEEMLVIEEDRRTAHKKQEDPLAKALGLNPFNCRKPLVPFEEFYNELLCDNVEMDNDYLIYRSITSTESGGLPLLDMSKNFCFMQHAFILTTTTKTLALYYDSRIRMLSERRLSAMRHYMIPDRANAFLNLRIRRDHIIEDALVELEIIAMSNPKDLKKQLVVEFTGEQGIDEGGVSKEFFQLIIEEIFNPDYGMFVTNEETNVMWFNSLSFENEAQFTLIGIVLGLAIYNNIILAVNFPLVVYRKLMGMRGRFPDLKDLYPVVHNSLASLLEYSENDMEEVFMQTFKIGYQDVFGNTLEYELKPDGDKINVTQDNKVEFMELYCDFLLNKSVEKQFNAFQRGFQMVTDESPLHLLFRPEEIELIVCGSKEFDFNELEQSTEYEGGFTAESQTIKDFWTITHGLSLENKRKLLQFTTGSDRVPVGGLSRLKLVIARNGPDSDRMPTSHTCFNVLLLPEYDSKEKLEERLLKAITYSKGFGML